MSKTPDYIKDLYINFVKPISKQSNIEIEVLLETMFYNNPIKYETTYPIKSASYLDIGIIMMGMDNFAYVVKKKESGKYWHKIPRL